MKPDRVVQRCLDAPSVVQNIITANYSEIPWANVSSLTNRCRAGFWQILDDEPRKDKFYIPELNYKCDERGDELELGLLKKRTGESKKILSPLEIAEGRIINDANKHRFHFGYDLPQHLEPQLLVDYKDFFSAGRILNNRARMIALSVANAFDVNNHRQKIYPGSLMDRISQSSTFTRLIRYEESKDGKLVLFDHQRQPVFPEATNPWEILIFPGTKFWTATRGAYGTGTLHGVHGKEKGQIDATLHRDRSCLTIHWISASDIHGYRFAVVSFVHCALSPEDVAWFSSNIGELKIDHKLYAF